MLTRRTRIASCCTRQTTNKSCEIQNGIIRALFVLPVNRNGKEIRNPEEQNRHDDFSRDDVAAWTQKPPEQEVNVKWCILWDYKPAVCSCRTISTHRLTFAVLIFAYEWAQTDITTARKNFNRSNVKTTHMNHRFDIRKLNCPETTLHSKSRNDHLWDGLNIFK
jgi:hypothetical protein